MNKQLLWSIIRLLFIILGTIGGIFIILFIAKLTYPFIIAFVIAFLLNPLVNLLNFRFKIHRGIAVFISIVIVIAGLVGVLTLLVTEIIAGSNYLIQVVPDNFEKIISFVQDMVTGKLLPLYDVLSHKYSQLGIGQQDTIRSNIQSIGNSIIDFGKTILTGVLNGLTVFITLLPNTATVLVISILSTFFISKDWFKLKERIENKTPERIKGYAIFIFADLRKAFFGYIRAHLTLISITTVIVLIGLLILRIPFAVTIALIIGFADLLPYLGTGTIFVPWILYTFLTSDFSLTIGLSILFAVVIVCRQVMEPKIISSNIGLNPLPTLIALFVGFKLLGFLGLILGPVTLVIFSTLYRANVFHEIWNYVIGKKD
jgi:sporulation integral membrane protein YtvI